MKMWICGVLLMVSLAGARGVIAQTVRTHVVPGGDAEVAEVREVAAAFLSKVSAGDLAGAKELFAGSASQEALLRASIEAVNAGQAVKAALAAKFGEAGKQHALSQHPFGDRFSLRAGSVEKYLYVVAGDRVSMSGGELFFPSLAFAKIEGKWRVSHLDSVGFTLQPTLQLTQTMRDVLIEIAGDIRSGKLENLDQVSASASRFNNAARQFSSDEVWTRCVNPKPKGATWKSPSAEMIHSLVGRAFLSPRSRALIEELPGLPSVLILDTHFILYSEEAGIRIDADRESKNVRMVLLLGGGNGGAGPYSGELPHGLRFDQTTEDVEKRIGPPATSEGGEEGSPLTLIYPQLGLVLRLESVPGDTKRALSIVALVSAE